MRTPSPLPFVHPEDKPYLQQENAELQKIADALKTMGTIDEAQHQTLCENIRLGEVLDIPKAKDLNVLECIGNVRRSILELPNGNTLVVQMESENPFGSHYDRVYKRLLSDFVKGDRGDKDVLEISSGNAAVSCTVIAQLYGKRVSVVIPRTAYPIRQTFVQRLGATVYPSPQEEGLGGANKTLRQLLRINSDQGKPSWFLSHSELDSALESMAPIAKQCGPVDYFFSAMGNGTTLRGIGGEYKDRYGADTQIVGVRYIPPDSHSREMLVPGGDQVSIPFRHLQEFPPDAIEWVDLDRVHERHHRERLGITSAMVKIAVDQFITRKNISDKTFLVIDYDHYNRYSNGIKHWRQA